MIKLVCPECRRENEPERIFCHDCGARLDRSALAKVPPKEEDAEATHRRVKAMFDGRAAILRHRFFSISKLILAALVTAAVVQMVRPPDLPPVPTTQGLPPAIGLDLENATGPRRAAPLHYTNRDVNAFLASTVKSKQAMLSKWLNFDRAVVDLQENYASLTAQRSLFGLPIYTTGSYAVALQNGAFAVASRGGSIGRLPVHPMLMKYAGGVLFGDLVNAVDRERKLALKLGSIELHPDMLVLNPKAP